MRPRDPHRFFQDRPFDEMALRPGAPIVEYRMRMCMKYVMLGALFTGALAVPSALESQTLEHPDGWKTRAERFVAMPPGFHVTTTASVLFYHPEARAEGEFTVTSAGFLFRGDSPNTYGLFIGGRHLEGDAAAWTSFEIGHDGNWVVRERRPADDIETGFHVVDLAGPAPGPVALPGDEMTARNALTIVAGPDYVEFRLNGETVTRLPRRELPVDGIVGFRVGSGLNLHLVSLSVTSGEETKDWAPARPDAPEGGGS